MRFERVEVECYSGYRANERPTAFTHAGTRHPISEVMDRWYEGSTDPPLYYFKVKSESGEEYLLRYNGLFDAWAICLPDDDE